MTKQLGPTFGNEVIAAGLGKAPFVWGGDDASIIGRESLTPAQNAALDRVIKAHDHTKQPLPAVTVEDVILHDYESRLRILEGKPLMTLEDFVEKKAKTKAPDKKKP
jgi:hypothetical protein